jgi:hypothetical protein
LVVSFRPVALQANLCQVLLAIGFVNNFMMSPVNPSLVRQEGAAGFEAIKDKEVSDKPQKTSI